MERAAHGLRPALLCKFNPLFSFLLPVDSAFPPDIATLGRQAPAAIAFSKTPGACRLFPLNGSNTL
jgi:hypothetical protein